MQGIELDLAVKIAIIFSGIFLWVGMLTGGMEILANPSVCQFTGALLCRYCSSQQSALCPCDIYSGSIGLLFSIIFAD